mmetsp:Transcript_14001/g.17241  ORF Transcript_14001/g.17241 Transcript_14001/m.17241 type:complete len:85 (+) Transcript_14001:1-255(+)
MAMKAFNHYDTGISKLFNSGVRTKITEWKGKLQVYRFCEDLWQFFLKDATFKTQGNPTSELVFSKEVHIIACDGRSEKTRKRKK